ncbi:MAG: phosphate/phosphite/phosphonate ABC transporter substrate-binding protein [Rhodospirillales bacterium]|nr:MAG: phosphate/phosphite/phosphonate ABC transporter substrate-binding protein [Rhodospirillales bacterium]
MIRTILCVVALILAFTAAPAAESPVRFGLTAVVVRDDLQLYDRWSSYLSKRVGRPVQFVQARSYREIMGLLQAGGLDFAWICGYPFVQQRDPETLELLAVPVYEGAPLYRSYIIVHRDSPISSLAEMKGRVFAFSDPDSNSGYLVPQAMLAERGHTPQSFFRLSFFTYSHAETIEAVAEGLAEGGAVDSYVWEYLDGNQPDLTARTRIIARSETFGFPPLVARLGIGPELRYAMSEALIGMTQDAEGRELLAQFALDGFAQYPPGLFDSIRDMADSLRQVPLVEPPPTQTVRVIGEVE